MPIRHSLLAFRVPSRGEQRLLRLRRQDYCALNCLSTLILFDYVHLSECTRPPDGLRHAEPPAAGEHKFNRVCQVDPVTRGDKHWFGVGFCAHYRADDTLWITFVEQLAPIACVCSNF